MLLLNTQDQVKARQVFNSLYLTEQEHQGVVSVERERERVLVLLLVSVRTLISELVSAKEGRGRSGGGCEV